MLAAAVLTTPAKSVSGFWSGRWYDLSGCRAFRVGIALVTRGEFTLIIAPIVLTTAGSAGGVIRGDVARTLTAFAVWDVLVMSVLGTTLLTPAEPVTGLIDRIRDRAGADVPRL